MDAFLPQRISSDETSVTGSWLSESDRFLTADYLEKERIWDTRHTLLPDRVSGATINQGVEVVVGMSHRGRGQKNSEQLHVGQY